MKEWRNLFSPHFFPSVLLSSFVQKISGILFHSSYQVFFFVSGFAASVQDFPRTFYPRNNCNKAGTSWPINNSIANISSHIPTCWTRRRALQIPSNCQSFSSFIFSGNLGLFQAVQGKFWNRGMFRRRNGISPSNSAFPHCLNCYCLLLRASVIFSQWMAYNSSG